LEPLRTLGAYATGGLTPDLTIYLDIDVQDGLQRKQADGGEEWNRMEEKALAFHQAVRAGYHQLAAAEPMRWLVVDAAQSIDAVHTMILARVQEVLATQPPAAGQKGVTA
jgi:dTMP kinase